LLIGKACCWYYVDASVSPIPQTPGRRRTKKRLVILDESDISVGANEVDEEDCNDSSDGIHISHIVEVVTVAAAEEAAAAVPERDSNNDYDGDDDDEMAVPAEAAEAAEALKEAYKVPDNEEDKENIPPSPVLSPIAVSPSLRVTPLTRFGTIPI